MKKTIKYIAEIILATLLCNCQDNTTSAGTSDSKCDTINLDVMDTVSIFETPDSLFWDCSSYLNAYAVEDMEELREYMKCHRFYNMYLNKIETVDGSPIDELTRKELEKNTISFYSEDNVINGYLRCDLKHETLNLNKLRQSKKLSGCFADNYDEIAAYFEKAYEKLGVQVSFDSVKVLSTKNHAVNWLSCLSLCGFSIVGDFYHRCLIIDKKYVLWFSTYKELVTKYELDNYEFEKDRFFEDPLPNYEELEIDTTLKKIASKETCNLYYMDNPEGVDMSIYDYMIVHIEGWGTCYLIDINDIAEGYNVTILPDYKGYHVIYVNYGRVDNADVGQLIVYSDSKSRNQSGTRLLVDSYYAFGNRMKYRRFDIFEDYTIRVKGKQEDPEKGVDKSITRYYRINDEGKFYEVTGREN